MNLGTPLTTISDDDVQVVVDDDERFRGDERRFFTEQTLRGRRVRGVTVKPLNAWWVCEVAA